MFAYFLCLGVFRVFRYLVACIKSLHLNCYLLTLSLRKLKKSKVEQFRMKDIQNDRYNEGHNYQNHLVGIREHTLGDCWKPMLNENYSS